MSGNTTTLGSEGASPAALLSWSPDSLRAEGGDDVSDEDSEEEVNTAEMHDAAKSNVKFSVLRISQVRLRAIKTATSAVHHSTAM